MKIMWLPIALRDRDAQIDFIAERNSWAAIDIGDAIEATIARISSHPKLGRPGRVVSTREMPVGGTRLVLVYRLERQAVVILRVLHGSQQWPAPT